MNTQNAQGVHNTQNPQAPNPSNERNSQKPSSGAAFSQQTMGHPMWTLFKYLSRYRINWVYACVASVINKVFDLMPPLLVGWLVAALSLQAPHWMGHFIDLTQPKHVAVFLAILTVIIFGIESISQWITDYGFKTLAQHAQHDLRLASYQKIQSREMAFFENHRLGETMAMLNDDVNQLERFLNSGFNQILQFAVLIVFSGYVLFSSCWQLALVGLSPVPIIVAGSIYFQHRIGPRYKKLRESVGALASRLENNLSGMMVIKSFTAEKFENERVEQASQAYRQANFNAIKLNTVFIPIIRMAVAVGFVGVLLFGSYWVLDNNHYGVTLANLVVFSMLVQRVIWPLTGLGQVMDDYERAKASAERTFNLLKVEPLIKDPEHPIPFNRAEGALSFKQVSFYYQSHSPILKKLNLEINARETVGVVGHTGSGKSTLIKLLLRLYEANDGIIALDGVDIRHLTLRDLRRQIALVSQDVYLFHGSILENIAYGAEQVSFSQVQAAAKMAKLHDFILTLPDGYHSIVGERGIKLSGGQRQRLSIARAVLKDAPIIVLDEATSSIDTQTEKEIQQNLNYLTAGKTSIIVAHRLSTIRQADRILVIKDGQIVEQGHHDDLVSANGIYSDLWAVQCGIISQESDILT